MTKWLNPDDAVDTRGWGDFDIIKDQVPNHKTTMMPQGTFPTIDPPDVLGYDRYAPMPIATTPMASFFKVSRSIVHMSFAFVAIYIFKA
ncbi:hypothetical protein EV2_047908 [Malus domestica]